MYVLFGLLCSNTFAQDKKEFKFDNGKKAYIVKSDKGWGVADSTGKVIVPTIYAKVTPWASLVVCDKRNGGNGYCSIYNSSGECKITEDEKHRRFTFLKSDGVLLAISNNENCVPTIVIDGEGNTIYKYKIVKDVDGFVSLHNELRDTIIIPSGKYTNLRIDEYGFIETSIGMKKGICKLDGTTIIPAIQYKTIRADVNILGTKEIKGFKLFLSESDGDGFVGYADLNGKCVIPATTFTKIERLENDCFSIVANDNVGIADSTGKVVFMTNYHTISFDKYDGTYMTGISQKYNSKDISGIMNLQGKEIRKPICYGDTFDYVCDNKPFVMSIDKNGKYGIQTQDGKTILQNEYVKIRYNKKTKKFELKKNGFQGLADIEGNIIIPCNKYDYISTELLPYYVVGQRGRNGLCDSTGREILKPLYDRIEVINVKEQHVIAQIGLMLGVVDFKGNIVVPFEYTYILPDPWKTTDRYHVSLFSKRGVCEKDGRIVIPVIYTEVFQSSTGDINYYSVHDGETSGIYSMDGKMLFPSNLFKHVSLNNGKNETRFLADYYIAAFNDWKENICYFDLQGKMLYDDREDKLYDKFFNEAGIEFDNNNYKKAIDLYEKALSYRQDGLAYYNIGVSYYNLAKYKEAIIFFNRCKEINHSQSVSDRAMYLIEECKDILQKKRERREKMWLGVLGSALNVTTTLIFYNNAINTYNSNLESVRTNRGGIKRDTNLDYLLDPRYAMMQVNMQNWNEYLQMTNGGQTMTYEEWYAIKAQTWAESQKIENEDNSISTNSSSNSSNSTITNGKMCRLCVGLGRCKTCAGRGWYNNPLDLRKEVLCPNCHNHDGKCSSCGGTGYK